MPSEMLKLKLRGFIAVVSIAMLPGCGNMAVAQDYYKVGDTIRGQGIEYVCDVSTAGNIVFHNVNNRFTHTEQRKKDGGEIEHNIFEPKGPQPYEFINNNYGIFHNLINMVFTDADKEKAREDFLIVRIFLDSNTGLASEVDFGFNKDKDGFCRVAPESYFALEKKIRQYICVKLNDLGRSYNYNIMVIGYNGGRFGRLPLDYKPFGGK